MWLWRALHSFLIHVLWPAAIGHPYPRATLVHTMICLTVSLAVCCSRCVSLSLCLALADIHLLWTGALSGVCFTAVTQTETVLYSCVSKSEGCCMVRWQSLTRGAELMTMNCYRRRFLSCRLGGAHNGMHVWFTWNVFPNIILVRIVAHPTTKHDLQIH